MRKDQREEWTASEGSSRRFEYAIRYRYRETAQRGRRIRPALVIRIRRRPQQPDSAKETAAPWRGPPGPRAFHRHRGRTKQKRADLEVHPTGEHSATGYVLTRRNAFPGFAALDRGQGLRDAGE